MSDAGGKSVEVRDFTVEIDEELCVGTGACARSLPAVFEIEDSAVGFETGKARVRDDVPWSEIDRERVTLAAQTCPWSAIEVQGKD